MTVKIQVRRGTAAQWTTADPVLSQGEIGFETNTNKFKIGDGSTNWSGLTYFIDEDGIASAISGAALSTTDDLPEGVQNLYFSAQHFAELLTAQPNFKSQGVQCIQGIQGLQGTAGYIGADGSQGIQGKIGRAHV